MHRPFVTAGTGYAPPRSSARIATLLSGCEAFARNYRGNFARRAVTYRGRYKNDCRNYLYEMKLGLTADA